MDSNVENDVMSDNMSEDLSVDLEQLNEGLDSSDIEDGLQELAAVASHGRQTFLFLHEDEEFQRVLSEGGHNPSVRMDKWALNRLNAYRKFRGVDTSIALTDMTDGDRVLLLTKFFEQACKVDGSLYPTQSLMSLYRAFHRVLIKAQIRRIQKTGTDERPFSMKLSPMYQPVGRACVLAMHRSRSQGANLPRKKASVISIADERVILSHSCTSKTNARGLQKRCAYYMLSRFCIRGGSELYSLRAGNFMLGGDEHGDFVKYDERLSKNYKVSMDRYQEEHFRAPITEYDADVYETMVLMIKHAPTSVSCQDRFLFYQAIDSPRSVSWYTSARVSLRNLCKWMKLIHEECGLISDGISNKSGRTTCVTRMAVEGVPPAVGMLITGHKSSGAYARYDRSFDTRVRAAQKCIAEGSDFALNLKDETAKVKAVLEGAQKAGGGIETQQLKKLKQASEVGSMEGGSRCALSILDENLTTGAMNEQASLLPLKMKENVAKENLSVQSTEEYDKWAEMINWEKVDGELASKGVYVGRNIINPITAVFGKNAVFGNNCNITICLGGNLPNSGAVGDVSTASGSATDQAIPM